MDEIRREQEISTMIDIFAFRMNEKLEANEEASREIFILLKEFCKDCEGISPEMAISLASSGVVMLAAIQAMMAYKIASIALSTSNLDEMADDCISTMFETIKAYCKRNKEQHDIVTIIRNSVKE